MITTSQTLTSTLTLDEAAARYARTNARVEALRESGCALREKLDQVCEQLQQAERERNLAINVLHEAAKALG